MHKITDRIFISDWADANDEHFLHGNQIPCVLNVCREKDADNVEGVKYVFHPMHDGPPTTVEELLSAVRTLDLLLSENDKVLVHCLAGISRSPMVVAVWIGWKHNTSYPTLEKALDFVARGRPIVDPNSYMVNLGKEVLKKLKGY